MTSPNPAPVVPPRVLSSLLAAAAVLLAAPPAAGQDSNILLPVAEIEEMLESGTFEVASFRDMRAEGDRTQLASLAFDEGPVVNTKWALAPHGGETFNNVPRYEVAAYEIQKLFLDESEYVVPPTVIRSFPLDWVRTLKPDAERTFPGTNSVLVVIQYMLWNIRDEAVWDRERLQEDEAYARHVGNLNVLTYLIRHSDSNPGNFLISEDPENPRVFAVDNGVTFYSEASDRGTFWRKLRVDRIPASTAERLRAITPADLQRALGVVAQFEIGPDGTLTRAEPTLPIQEGVGIRRVGNTVQFGLTVRELRAVHSRLERLVKDLDEGRIDTF